MSLFDSKKQKMSIFAVNFKPQFSISWLIYVLMH